MVVGAIASVFGLTFARVRISLIPTPEQMEEMLTLFAPHCQDLRTFRRLQAIVAKRRRWKEGYVLFQQIRKKTLRAERRNELIRQHQYYLEEICAKTLYNLSIPPEKARTAYPAPFDEDSAEHVLPIALAYAKILGLPPLDLNTLPTEPRREAPGGWRAWGIRAMVIRVASWMRR